MEASPKIYHLITRSKRGFTAQILGGLITYLLLAIYCVINIMSTDKRGISAHALSKKIGVSYWVAWTMLQKIRRDMKDRDSKYKLAGLLE